ncbi:MAG: response regulator [Deltaproteobacteria bacterium]|uniref:Response regulator n=1 Tax=Candidatus Desulfacyla euxinica TaxID=2841693 RepID=A0A8J6T3H8_9DELT|nr:response regulator [Candidatus Desulfacyla euxinica]
MEEVRVLLVDDEVEFADTLAKRMKKRKLITSSVNSGEDALEFLGQNPTDVVILDVKMPGIDGIQTLREIKQQYPLIEVIMLTGHANVEVAIQGMEIGAFDYLMKPMAIDDLVYKIQDAYKKKSIHVEKTKERLQSSSG